MARPVEYKEDILVRAREYISLCVDEIEEYHKTRGDKSDSYDRLVRVRIPTIEGIAVHLGISRSTVYDWKDALSEDGSLKYAEFSYIIDELQAIQADRLLNNGLSGDYNPTIAKVLLTKHGYREGVDQTTNDKELPQPIINVIFKDNSNEEDSEPNQED